MHEKQMQLLTAQLEKATSMSHSSKSSTKMPVFDIDKDQDSFKPWLSRWKLHVQGHGLERISDTNERQARIMLELTSALSDLTLNWILNKNFDEKDRTNPEFVLKAIEEKISRSSNPLVHQIELAMITQYENESADNLIQRIQEKSNKCEFKSVKDLHDHQNMLTLLKVVNPEVQKKCC